MQWYPSVFRAVIESFDSDWRNRPRGLDKLERRDAGRWRFDKQP